MKRPIFLLLAGLLTQSVAVSQVIVRGTVVDAQQRPLPTATVAVVGSYAGASVGIDGTFSFETDDRGAVQIVAQMLGYTRQVHSLTITDTTRQLSLRFLLREEPINLEGVAIKARKTDFLGRAGLASLNPLEIRAMGGTNADIGNGIRTMPGVQATNEETGLFVRGGSADETKVYVDGLLANNFFYNGTPDVSQRGRFAPELFSGTFFSSGGYSALYGQALSSALILETNDVATRSSAGGSISAIGLTADVNQVIKREKLSAGGSVSYLNLNPYYQVVPQRRNFRQGPEFLDATFHLKYRTGDKGALKVLGTLGVNQVGLVHQNIPRPTAMGVHSRNGFLSASYAGSAGGAWSLNAGFGVSLSSNKAFVDSLPLSVEQASVFRARQIDQQLYNSRLVFRRSMGRGNDLYLGLDHVTTQTNRQFTRLQNVFPEQQLTEHYGALFAESNIGLHRTLSLRAGLRAEAATTVTAPALAPRLTLTYSPTRTHRFILSYGQFFQQPNPEFPIDQPTRPLQFAKATHYIASYQMTRANQLLRVEVFQKDYSRLVRTLPDTTSTGFGYARGIELLWREENRLPNLNYWVSYSYLDTRRQHLNFPRLAQPNFAATHTLSAVANYFIESVPLNIGLTYTLSSGRPYWNPNRPDSQFLADRAPTFQNLGATIAYLTRLGKAKATVACSVNNILGNEQIFGYQYITRSVREAVAPMAPRFFYVGLFLNWGIDKRNTIINNLNQ